MNTDNRDQILEPFFVYKQWSGGIKRFENLTLEALEKLVKEGYADPEDAQNEAETLGFMLEFMRKFPEVTAHGYAVEGTRHDCRVTLEGLRFDGKPTKEMILAFVDGFRKADEFICEANQLYCWYD